MSFIQVGYDRDTGTLLKVGGIRVLGLRAPVTLSADADVGGPNNPRPPKPLKNPSGGPRNPPHVPTSQAAPTNPRQVTPHAAPLLYEEPPRHTDPAPISAPKHEPGPIYNLLRGW